jgi:hypothetical protein
MKVAFLLFGQYRTFNTSVKTWNILNHKNIDVYISTWDKTTDRSKKSDVKKSSYDIDESMFRKYFPNAKINIEPYETWETDISTKYEYAIHYHWKKLYNMVLHSCVKYDLIILNRLDCYFYFHDFLNEIKNINANKLHLINSMHFNTEVKRWFATDVFFMGSYTIMMKFLKNLPKIVDPHFDLGDYIHNQSYPSGHNTNVYCRILRPNMINYFETYFKKNTYPPQIKDREFWLHAMNFDKNIHYELEQQFK